MTNKNLKSVCVSLDINIQRALENLETCREGILIIVDEQDCLLGTLTDGDLRRAQLRGVLASDPISAAANFDPIFCYDTATKIEINNKMRLEGVGHIPVVSKDMKLRDLRTIKNETWFDEIKNSLFVLAGGRGERLRPLTDATPKPMLKIAGRPILEHIIEQASRQGIGDIYISVNYLSEQIMQYFEEGSRFGVKISYICEDEPLGTIGSLALMRHVPKLPVIVKNGDVLVDLDYKSLLEFHDANDAMITVVVKKHVIRNPFGAVEIFKNQVSQIREKPEYHSFVNCGIYVISPSLINTNLTASRIDATELIDQVIQNNGKVAAFQLDGYWHDIGGLSTLESLREEWKNEI